MLKVHELSTWFKQGTRFIRAVDQVSFSVQAGQTLVIVGESGSGKSVMALSLMQLLPKNSLHGKKSRIIFNQQDLLLLPEQRMRQIRGRGISMIFQDPMTGLNPVLTIGHQLLEVIKIHQQLGGVTATKEAIRLLEAVRIPDCKNRMNCYPHELSGGMRQRIMIALALAGKPRVLIADEPTTALDVTTAKEIIRLIQILQREEKMAIIFITHDLALATQLADVIAVMYAGHFVEINNNRDFSHSPRHPYSYCLLKAKPSLDKREQVLKAIKGRVPILDKKFSGCRFVNRCPIAEDICHRELPPWHEQSYMQARCHFSGKANTYTISDEMILLKSSASVIQLQPLLKVKDLKVYFPVKSSLLRRTIGEVKAVDGLDFHIPYGKTLALVGESGSGKTTAARAILSLIEKKSGDIIFDRLTSLRSQMQVIFQDPFLSLNPKWSIEQIVQEGMEVHGIANSPHERVALTYQLLETVGLDTQFAKRYPHQLSGGQRQRVCIARALAVEPDLLVCDEPTSNLDVSIQAQILNLLKKLQINNNLSYLFITHDFSVVGYMAHTVAVMYLGKIIEYGKVEDVLQSAKHPFTQSLLAAVPDERQHRLEEVTTTKVEPPSPLSPPTGCHYHLCCPYVTEKCKKIFPKKTSVKKDHYVYCHLY